jgi:hypothetical protein
VAFIAINIRDTTEGNSFLKTSKNKLNIGENKTKNELSI